MARLVTVAAMALSTVLGLSGPAGAQLVPLGTQFQVNTYTTNYQGYPAIGTDAVGSFVVVWFGGGSTATDTDYAILGQRYDAAGAPVSTEFQVNTYTTSFQAFPAVATRGDGSFVVVWESYGSGGSDTNGTSIQGQRYDTTGSPVGAEFQVNTYTPYSQSSPSVAMDSTGTFVVVWASYGSVGSDTSYSSIQAQRYNAAAVPLGGQFQVNTYTTDGQYVPSVAANTDGSFVVVWQSYGSGGSDTNGTSIQGQRYDAAGAAIGSQFQVNTYTTSFQYGPRVAVDGSGSFVVVWQSYGSGGSDTSSASIQGQRYDAAGSLVGAEFQVNTYTTSSQEDPEVAMNADGSFVVTWESTGSPGTDSDGDSILAQRYDATGSPVGAEFQVNTYTTIGQYDPGIKTDAAGNLIIAWSGQGAGSDPLSVQAQRFAVGRPVLGKKLLVKDPTGSEDVRAVIALGKETATDIGAAILGDPTVSGATLRVITNGTTDSDQSYVLDAGGWTPAGTVGFKYAGPTAPDNDPVKTVLVKRTPGGAALVKAIIKGNVGTQSLDVVPPNLGDDGGIILTIPGGGTYCATFGGTAGGTEVKDDGQLWKVTNATAQGCPTP